MRDRRVTASTTTLLILILMLMVVGIVSSGPAVAKPSATTTTVTELNSGHYGRGVCITWNQRSTGRREVRVVSCAKPHVMEMVGVRARMAGRRYPTLEQWRAFIQQKCAPAVERYWSHPLDPSGRFTSTAIYPLVDAWNQGDHMVQCAIGGPADSASTTSPLVGSADPNDQSFVYPTGTCLGQGQGVSLVVVDCAAPHLSEVTGVVNLAGRLDHAPLGNEMYDLVGGDCAAQAEAYLGRPLDDGLAGFPAGISAESWAAGSRRVNCLVGRPEGQQLATLGGPLR